MKIIKSFRIDDYVLTILKEISKEKNITMSDAVRYAILYFYENSKKEGDKN